MRMQAFLLWAICFHALTFSAASASNPQYRCEPRTVETDAVAIAYATVDVAAFSDPNKHICTFAIDGAAPGSHPSSRQPVSELIGRLSEGDVTGITIRLTLARSIVDESVERRREELRAILADYVEDMANCFRALRSSDKAPDPKDIMRDGSSIYLIVESDRVTLHCTIQKPGKYSVLQTDYPTLRLRARWNDDRTVDNLFVPILALQ